MSANTNTGIKTAVTELDTIKNEVAEKANNTVQNLKEAAQQKIGQVGDKVEDYKGKVSGNLSDVAGKVHEKSDTAQEFLDTKAEKLNDYAHQAIKKANQYGHKTADALDASSEYVKNFNITETAQNLKSGITQRPGTSIVMIGVVGLLVGFLIGRSR